MTLPKVIYMMGPPGAGKGTQAELLAKEIGYHRFSTGDAFRQVAAQDTDLGHRTKALIDNGVLGPPEMAAEIVIAAVREHINRGVNLVFDGTPRTVTEAKIVDQFFQDHNYGRPLAILLKVDKQDMIERNAKRKFCLGIQGGFAVITDEDRQRCLAAGGTVGTRPDDDPKKFDTRWQQFSEHTMPVIEQYRREGILREVDGHRSIEDVHQDVLRVVRRIANGAP